MRQLPHPQQKQTSASSDEAACRRYTRPMNRVADDLVNQLCVLNLIASKIRTRMTDRPGVLSECDLQTFDRCIREASLLGEQMAQLLKLPVDKAIDTLSSTINPQGRVIRLLRALPKRDG